MNPAHLVVLIIVPLMVWRLVVRIKRNIGPQKFHPARQKISLAILSFVVLILVIKAGFHFHLLLFLASLGIGFYLSQWGLRLTKFETVDGQWTYTPDARIGVALSVIIVTRIAYSVVFAGLLSHGATPLAQSQGWLGFLIYGLFLGYYLGYQAGILKRGKAANL